MQEEHRNIAQQIEEYKQQNHSVVEAMDRFSIAREELRKAEDALHPVKIWTSNSTIPLEEGMAVYQQIKHRYDDLFRDLAAR